MLPSRGTPITAQEFDELLLSIPMAVFCGIRTETIGDRCATLRLPFSERLLRPGQTHSGPSLMAAIDLACYAAVLSIDKRHTGALTTELTMNFLKRPPNADLTVECILLSIDEARAVGKSAVFPATDPDNLVCTSTCGYAIPQS
jgi:acyl-coenzyme A thioesterase PaaI-like protein